MNIESLNKKYASFIATFHFNVVLRIGTSKQRKLRYYKILSTDVMIFFFTELRLKYLEIERSILDGRRRIYAKTTKY